MYHSAAKICLLLSFSALLVSAQETDPEDLVQGLDLETYNEEQVKGCFYYNRTLAICFDIQQHSMRLMKPSGEKIFLDQDIYPDSFFYQVLDYAFLGYEEKGLLIYIFRFSKNVSLNRWVN